MNNDLDNKHIKVTIPDYPDYVVVIIAKALLPAIQTYYKNSEGKELFVQSDLEDENDSSRLAA